MHSPPWDGISREGFRGGDGGVRAHEGVVAGADISHNTTLKAV